MSPLIIQDQFYTNQNFQRSPIPPTSNWSGTFFAISYSKLALDDKYFHSPDWKKLPLCNDCFVNLYSFTKRSWNSDYWLSLTHESRDKFKSGKSVSFIEKSDLRLEERVSGLEVQLNSNIELITQLRHNLTTKTELLHVYSNSAIEDYSPVKNKVSVETLQRKIRILEEENKVVSISVHN